MLVAKTCQIVFETLHKGLEVMSDCRETKLNFKRSQLRRGEGKGAKVKACSYTRRS